MASLLLCVALNIWNKKLDELGECRLGVRFKDVCYWWRMYMCDCLKKVNGPTF